MIHFVKPPNVCLQGLRALLSWLKLRYANRFSVPIVITENGCYDPTPSTLDDRFRVEYLSAYLNNVQKAIEEDGVDVRGYFIWSLLDNFEWSDGYSKRFGLYAVDDQNTQVSLASLERTPKASVWWLKKYIQKYREEESGQRMKEKK